MKNKWKILLPVGLIAFALVCIFGGQALVRYMDEQRLAELKAQQNQSVETPLATPENVVYTLPPVTTYTLPPAATGSSAPVVDEVEKDEDGNVTITPDFENQGNGAVEVVDPDVQVTANVNGGGGELPLESDGAYHGEVQPSATPKPTQAPPPATIPSPEPDNNGGPPSRKGSYDGEISPDGKYEWIEAGSLSGWVDLSIDNGGINRDDSDVVTGGLSGEKVGSM